GARFLGEAPFFEGRQRHGPDSALAPTGCQALLVQPLLEPFRLGVGGYGPLEQLPLDRQTDRIGGRVALAAPPSALGRFEGGEQLTADLARTGRRAVGHALPPFLGAPKAKPSSVRRRATIRASSAYPGRAGRR